MLLNYPIALAALALVLHVGGPRVLVWTSAALCALTAVPGVVDQSDLDVRWVNALPALGVALALALTVAAVARESASFAPPAYGDRLRLALAVVLILVSLPWYAAELGFHFPGDVFMGEEVPRDRDPGLAAVHLGFHHGNGGALLALAALALSRARPTGPVAALLSLMLAYGLANAGQDAWNEQLWKRGWVDVELPSVVRPGLTLGWLAIVVGAVLVHVLWFGRRRAP